MLKDLYKAAINDDDEIILVVGDSDHYPVAEAIIEEGKKYTLAFWDNASELMKTSSKKFISLNPHIRELERKV